MLFSLQPDVVGNTEKWVEVKTALNRFVGSRNLTSRNEAESMLHRFHQVYLKKEFPAYVFAWEYPR